MKTERTYLWRVIDRGKPRVTSNHFTEEQVRRDYPECTPEPLLDTLVEEQVPETAEEMLRRSETIQLQYGASTGRPDSK